jgi:hypothetical protein
MIKAGADVHALSRSGQTPTMSARKVGLERSWREALRRCGQSSKDIYARSGVEWTNIPEGADVADEILEILYTYGCNTRPSRSFRAGGWSHNTLLNYLQSAIRNLNGSEREDEVLRASTVVARHAVAADYAWRTALRACGHEPTAIYSKACVSWKEIRVGESDLRLHRYEHPKYEYIGDSTDTKGSTQFSDGHDDDPDSWSAESPGSDDEVLRDTPLLVEDDSRIQQQTSRTTQNDTREIIDESMAGWDDHSAHEAATNSVSFTPTLSADTSVPLSRRPEDSILGGPPAWHDVQHSDWTNRSAFSLPALQQEYIASGIPIPDYSMAFEAESRVWEMDED